jgi:glycosyltransferase involved in cell wall biosynthesis
MRPLRVAMIGQKGIPARYGGVETHVEAIATRLAARGHEVWVYCRSRLRPDAAAAAAIDGYRIEGGAHAYRGVRLAYRPSVPSKHLDAATHAAVCALEAGRLRGFDVVHFHGIGPSAFAPFARGPGRAIVSTFHALDWRQVKWGPRAKRLLKRGEARGARASDAVIAVSRVMQEHVRQTHGVEAEHIPNGADAPAETGQSALARWGLAPGGYLLTVGRIIKDREVHTLLDAFAGVEGPFRLVVVGSEHPRTGYSDRLEAMADGRVVFTGEVFGPALQELYRHCLLYVLASRVEGLPITVCEAMVHGRPLLLSDIAENQEVGSNAAAYFKCGDSNALQSQLRVLIEDGPRRRQLGEAARARARRHYGWDEITDRIESLYYRTLTGHGRPTA